MADRRTPKRKNETEPKASTAKKARRTSVASRSSSVAESHDDATQTTNLDANGGEVHWEWENEEEVITKTTITEDRIISLRSKTISTPIQRSVLAVSHIYTHGRQLQDGDIGRLVNADEDEVLEIDCDQESEISTPARRLYQRGSIGGSARSTRSDTAPARRSSRARGDNDTTSESGLQSLEYTSSSTSRSSRRSTSGRLTNTVSSNSSGVPALTTTSSTSVSTRRTSSAATTAALTIATPLGRRRSTRGSVSNASSAASTPVASRQTSPTVPASPLRNVNGGGSIVLAPAVLAFNQQQEDYHPPDDNFDAPDEPYVPYVPPREAVDEAEEGVLSSVVRVVTAVARHYMKSLVVVVAVVVVCIVAVYVRTALKVPPTHISPVASTFKHDYKHTTPNTTTSTTALLLQQQLEAQRVELETINTQLQHTKAAWESVVSSAEGVAGEVSSVHSSVVEALDAFTTDASLLDTHLRTLHTHADTTVSTLHTTLHSFQANDTVDTHTFTTQLAALAPQVTDLTLQAQELEVLVQSGISVLQGVVNDLPHASAADTANNPIGSTITVESVINAAREAEAHLTATNTHKQTNNTLLNITVANTTLLVEQAQHTLRAVHADYAAAHESASLLADEALKTHNKLQAESFERATQSIEAAKQAIQQNEALQSAYAAQAALQEAERREQEAIELAQVPTFNVLNVDQTADIVRDSAEHSLYNTTAPLLTTLKEKVSSGVREVYDSVVEQNRIHNIDTTRSDIVTGQLKQREHAQQKKHEAIRTHKHSTTTDTDTNINADDSTDTTPPLPLHDYAVAPRGGSVVHYRKLYGFKHQNDHTLTSAPYTQPRVDVSVYSAVSGKHGGNKKYTVFPRSVHANVVVNHHRPTVDNFYPLPVENRGRGSVIESSIVRSDGKQASVSSAGQITVVLKEPVSVHSVKLVHATRNTSNSDSSIDSDGTSTSVSLQPCAPYKVRLLGWPSDPTPRSSSGAFQELGVYSFDSYDVSTSYLKSESSGEGTAVYEQEFDIAEYWQSTHPGSEGKVPVLRAVTMQVLSNHGEVEFSCVHRIQVIGALLHE